MRDIREMRQCSRYQVSETVLRLGVLPFRDLPPLMTAREACEKGLLTRVVAFREKRPPRLT
jgi:hypothetical protein